MNISAKLPTEVFDGPRYTIVAWSRGHEILFYREFGSYHGEWAMISYCDGEYYLWKGYYGSCSGCDHYEDKLPGDLHSSDASVIDFIKEYHPFIEVPAITMRNLVVQGWEAVGRIIPANIRDDGIEDYDLDSLAKDITLIAKFKEGLPITLQDVMDARDQEIKQRALKQYGYERFVSDSGAQVLDESGEDRLLGLGDIKLLSLKDSTTDRRYLLRVPPNIERVKQGVAWTFDINETQWDPLVET